LSDAAAISVRGLTKEYRLGQQKGRSALTEVIVTPFRRNGARRGEWFRALDEVSFDVASGTALGIVGRNGAGKSTLLKLLSRITKPTDGQAVMRGRVGSLLEVGTGFHPELNGRENVFMNGAMLGMRKAEIARKFDEIVAFAEVERFIDTPVKRYSTGMYVRLAFAVAAHLEPEILLIDEVLAVGDASFQKKCLGKMGEAAGEGRTVLFVSHSTPSILRLCDRVVLLDQGRVVSDGPSHEVIRRYLDSGLGSAVERTWETPEAAPGDDLVRLKAVRVRSEGVVREQVDIRKPVEIEVEYWQLSSSNGLRPSVNLHVTNDDGVLLFVTNDFNNRHWWESPRGEGVVQAACCIPGNFLAEGRHIVLTAISTYNPTEVHVLEPDAVSFQVVDRSDGDGVRGEYANEWPGVIRPMLDWDVNLVDQEVLLRGDSIQ